MISTTNRIASDRNITVWVVPEVTPGVLVPPTAANIIGAFDITYPTQVPEYTNSKERAQTRDVLNRCQGQLPAGEWAFSTYCRPDGLGNVPTERDLLTGLAGVETVDPGVDVLYSLTLQKPSYSLWFLVDHTMMFCAGATIGSVEVNLEECSLTYQWSGGFMYMGVAGTDPLLGAAVATEAFILVSEVNKYSIGGRVILADADGVIVDDNGGEGYEVVTNDNPLGIGISPVLAIGAGADGFCAPLDVGGTLSGNPLETRTALVNINGVDKPIVGFTFTVTDEPEYLAREKTPEGYPVSYAETQREVGGELNLVFRRDDADAFRLAYEGAEVPIILTVGDLDGYIVKFNMPRTKLDVPAPEESEPIVELNTEYTAIATNGEDSYTIQYI